MANLATTLLLLCMVHSSLGAERVDVKALLRHMVYKRHAGVDPVTLHRFKRDSSEIRIDDLDDVIGLGDDTKLDAVKVKNTVQGTQLFKMQERYKDHVVSDGIVTIETDVTSGHVVDATGSVYRNIESDLDHEEGDVLDPEDALDICLSQNFDEYLRDDVTHIKVELQILLDEDSRAYQAYLVQYLVFLEGEQERRPTCLVHATLGQIVESWDALDSCTDCKATGTGGNLRVGKIRYGELHRCLSLRREGDRCYLENKYVKIIDNNSTDVTRNATHTPDMEVASYDCEEIEDEVNGAYSPMLDALFYGTVVGRMYEDWYNTTALPNYPMTFRLHYGANVSNAYWNGYECQFGDGGDEFYPLVSLDIVGHEVGHGLTESNANLYYYQQWGGINEAFSDMAGETAEAYLLQADWVMGLDISKLDKPLRFFQDPSRDNKSIGHADNFTDTMDPHHSSGVFNRVFYLLVNNHSIPVRDVFAVFLHANQMYWHHMTSYVTAACDVMKAAYDLGQDGGKVRRAFRQVGLEVCDTADHVMGLRRGEEYTGISVSPHASPSFTFSVPSFAQSVTVNASSPSGKIRITVTNATWGEEEEEGAEGWEEGEEGKGVEVFAEDFHFIQFDVPDNSTSLHLTVTLSSDSATPLSDVRLRAWYECVESLSPSDDDPESYLMYVLWKEYCVKRGVVVTEDKSDPETATDKGNETESTDRGDETKSTGKADWEDEMVGLWW